MKTIIKLFLPVLLLGTASAADPSKADADHAEMEAVLQEPEKVDRAQQTPEYMETHAAKSSAATLRFYLAHPEDPRRWRALNYHVGYVRDLRNGAERKRKNAHALLRAALASPDISDAEWEQLKGRQIRELGDDVFAAPTEQRKAKLPALRVAIDELARRIPQAPTLVNREMSYNRLLAEVDPAAARLHMESLAKLNNEGVRRVAEGRLKVETLREQPLDLKFTAVDGSEVDLKTMRGKVVLLDFWATWCGPCIAELPNIQKVYRQYHDKGFEVVGVSLDSQDDAGKLKTFIKERGVPWPQHFDGLGWKNRFAQEFGVMAIPEQLLFDQQGKLVSNKARGEVLQTEVKRLLGL